jgi:hypothetical protein
MNRSILVFLFFLFSSSAFAETGCRVIEYPDNVEIDCSGDEVLNKAVGRSADDAAPGALTQKPAAITGQTPQNSNDGEGTALVGSSKSPAPETSNIMFQAVTTVSNQSAQSVSPAEQSQSRQQSKSSLLQDTAVSVTPVTASAAITAPIQKGNGNGSPDPASVQPQNQLGAQNATIVRRQGRQQFQQSLEEARASRVRMILDTQGAAGQAGQ